MGYEDEEDMEDDDDDDDDDDEEENEESVKKEEAEAGVKLTPIEENQANFQKEKELHEQEICEAVPVYARHC